MVHKIDGEGATALNEFTEGDSVLGVPYTWITDDWLNMVQRELVGVVEAAGLVPTKGNDGQLLSALELLGASAEGNALWNSNFDVWGRRPNGKVGITAREMLADRWISEPGDGGTITIQKETASLSLGDLFGQANRYHGEFPRQVLRHDQTVKSTAGGTVPFLAQRVIDVRTLAGGKAVVSFFASSDIALNVTPVLVQHFGQGGSASAEVTLTGSAIAVPGTSVPAFFSQTFTLASVTGKTIDLGTDPETWLEVRFEFSDDLVFTLDLWNVRCDTGSIPRPNLWVPLQFEQDRCRSLWEWSGAHSDTPFSGTTTQKGLAAMRYSVQGIASEPIYLERRYRTRKRFATIASWMSPPTVTLDKLNVGGTIEDLLVPIYGSRDSTGLPRIDGTPAMTGLQTVSGHWLADCELPIA